MSGGDGIGHNSGAHNSGGNINGGSAGSGGNGGASDNSGWSSENNPWGEVTAVFTGEVVLAPVMAVVNMGVKQVGGGAVPLIRMYRLLLTQMGRCALPSQMVW